MLELDVLDTARRQFERYPLSVEAAASDCYIKLSFSGGRFSHDVF
jgi:hypothetical protein